MPRTRRKDQPTKGVLDVPMDLATDAPRHLDDPPHPTSSAGLATRQTENGGYGGLADNGEGEKGDENAGDGANTPKDSVRAPSTPAPISDPYAHAGRFGLGPKPQGVGGAPSRNGGSPDAQRGTGSTIGVRKADFEFAGGVAPSDAEREIDGPPAYDSEPGMYPLPEIFWRVGSENKPTRVGVDTVHIWKKIDGKNLSFQGNAYQKFFALQDCSTLENLLSLMGPGTFMVQGRSNCVRGIIAQAWQTVGEPEVIQTTHAVMAPSRAELDIGKVASTIVAALAPFVTVVTTWLSARSQSHEREVQAQREQVLADRDRADRMAADTMAREAERSKEFLTAITGLMSARTQDLEALIRGMQSGGGGSGSDKSYREGQADMMAMLDAAKASGVTGGDTENKVIDLVQGLLAGGGKASGEVDILKQIGALQGTPTAPKPEGP